MAAIVIKISCVKQITAEDIEIYSLSALTQYFRAFPQHSSRIFTICLLSEYSIHKFNRNSVFILYVQKYFSKKLNYDSLQKVVNTSLEIYI